MPKVAKSLAARKTQAMQIARRLAEFYADAECALHHRNAYELIVATILSAQCTDARVNIVTPALFKTYPNPGALAKAKQEDVEELVKTTGFFRAKAANLIAMAQGVVEQHDGKIPQTLEDLVKLPGVGRKTANVVLGTAFGIAVGVVVDTHVKRITYLLGLTKATQPEKVEADLMQLLPAEEWVNFSHRLIHHGRRICIARRPKCKECPLLDLCARVGLPPLS
jgi:endonuclease III